MSKDSKKSRGTRDGHAAEQAPVEQTEASHVTNGGVPVPPDNNTTANSTAPVNHRGGHNGTSNPNTSAAVNAENGQAQVNGHAPVVAPAAAGPLVVNGSTPARIGSSNINGAVPLHAASPSPNGINGVGPHHNSTLSGSAQWFKPHLETRPITYLNRGSSADDASSSANVVYRGGVTASGANERSSKGKGKARARQDPIGTPGVNTSPTRPPTSFTTDVGPGSNAPGGHYLKLEQITAKQGSATMLTMNEDFDWDSKVTAQHYDGEGPIKASDRGDLFLRFDDVRDSAAAFEQVETVDPTLKLSYVSQSEYAASMRKNSVGPQTETAFHDGQVILTCEFKDFATDFHEQKQALEGNLKKLADECGDVLVFAYHSGEGGKMLYRVEFYSISAAKAVVKSMTKENPGKIGGWTITAEEMRPQVAQPSLPDHTQGNRPVTDHSRAGISTPGAPRKAPYGTMYHGRTAVPDPGALVRHRRYVTPPSGTVVFNGGYLPHGGNHFTPPPGAISYPGGYNTPQNVVHQEFYATVSPMTKVSPTGRTAWVLDNSGKRIPMPPPKPVARVLAGPPVAGPSRSYSEPVPITPANAMQSTLRHESWPRPSHTSGQLSEAPTPTSSYQGSKRTSTPDGPNKIYPTKIKNGTDVRTSVMIRNLPNELTFEELKRLLDLTSFGRYDFSYLRIDFNNNKNVGYGFVNFCDAMDILPFYYRYIGKPWIEPASYDGRRVRKADLSYASIQGLDGLIDKFRNSAVMDENHDYRPKYWWTNETTLNIKDIGTERDFPIANNRSKKMRSVDNAQSIGLFGPGSRDFRGGMGFQSQYDRGTMAQIQEEAYLNQRFQNQGNFVSQDYAVARPSNMVMHQPFPHIPPGHPMQPPPVNQYQQPSMGNGMFNGMNDGMIYPMGNGITPGMGPMANHMHNGMGNGMHNVMTPGMAPVIVNGMAPANRGFYQPFNSNGGYYGGFGGQDMPPPHPHYPRENVYVPPHARRDSQFGAQYGPMNEVLEMPVAPQGMGYPSGQELHEMPAIPEETGEYQIVDGEQADENAEVGAEDHEYDENGVSYTLPEDYDECDENGEPYNPPNGHF